MSAPGRAVVFGLGRFGGGAGAARRLAHEGWDVLVTDLASAEDLAPTLARLEGVPLRLRLGEHAAEDFEDAALVVANPAVPPGHDLLARARSRGARITTEVELFLERAPGPLLGVTGTQGKSSTVRMAADFLTAAGRPARAGGNLGGSLLDDLEDLGPGDTVVLELSSYQLEHLSQPAPRLGAVAVTNVLADHLERHGSAGAYARAKRRILELLAPAGVAFLPAELDWRPPRGRRVDVLAGERGGEGLHLTGGAFRWDDQVLGRVADLPLRGGFQRANALLALGLARAAGAAAEALASAVPRARGLEHRLEDLGRRGGRRVLDNGVSTTPDSTIAALEELGPEGVLVCGGKAKAGLSLDPLALAARRAGARVVAFGAAGPDLGAACRAAGVPVEVTADLEQAVDRAWRTPGSGTVLFSPACASFDAYANFRERALAFRAALPDPTAP